MSIITCKDYIKLKTLVNSLETSENLQTLEKLIDEISSQKRSKRKEMCIQTN